MSRYASSPFRQPDFGYESASVFARPHCATSAGLAPTAHRQYLTKMKRNSTPKYQVRLLKTNRRCINLHS